MLSSEDYDAINLQISVNLEALKALGIAVHRSHDMDAFRVTRQSLGSAPYNKLHPGLDPQCSHIAPRAGQWMSLRDENTGEIVGTTGCRLFRDESIVHLLQSRLIWREKDHPVEPIEPSRYDWDRRLYSVEGRLVFGGGAYVDRNYKNHGIGKAMAALMHAICLRLWEPDYFFNMMVIEKLDSPVNPKRFGYRHTAVVFDANTRPDWGPQNPCEIVNWKSRDG